MNFGTLRSLLHHQNNTPQTWFKLCRTLEQLNDLEQFTQTVLPYLTQHLQRWETATRRTPMNWVYELIHGRQVPWLPITRSMSWSKTPETAHPTFHAMSQQQLSGLLNTQPLAWRSVAFLDALAQPEHHLPMLFIAFGKQLRTVETLHLETPQLSVTQLEQWLHILPSSQLKHLTLSYKRMDMARLGTLLQSPNTQWHSLGLPHCRLSPVMMDLMASRLPQWPNLRVLSLQHNHLDRRGYQALAQLIAHTQLSSLDLRQTTYQHQGLLTLHSQTPLEHLYLSGVEDTAFDWSRLLHNPWLAQLKTLHLEQSTQGDTLLEALAHAPCRHSLETLILQQCRVTATGLKALKAAGIMSNLHMLDLSNNHLYEDFLEALGHLDNLPNLTSLCLRGDFLSPKNLTALAEVHPFTHLANLDLSNSNLHFQNQPISAWLKTPTLQQLQLQNVSLNQPLLEAVEQHNHRIDINAGHFKPFRKDASPNAVEACLQEYPSAQLWSTLSTLFHTLAKTHYTPQWIDAINHRLDQWWPIHLRTPTQLWWQRFNLQRAMPVWWKFLRAIYVNSDAQMIDQLIDQPNLSQTQVMAFNWYYHQTQSALWTSRRGHPEALNQLLCSRSVHGLDRLTIQCNAPGLSLFDTIGQSEDLRRLKHLQIQTQHLPPGALASLALSPNMQRLETLAIKQRVDGPQISTHHENTEVLFQQLNHGTLHHLRLEGIGLDAQSCRTLSALTLPQLEHLHLKHNSLSDREFIGLLSQEPTWWHQLKTLKLNQSIRLTDLTIEALASQPMPNLEHLELTGNYALTKQSKQWLEDNPNLPKLQTIVWPQTNESQ